MKTILLAVITLQIGVNSLRAGEWKLAWSDEFNYEGLPDKSKWDYEEGFVRNNEKQFYTRARLENARVENGVLIIECRKEHFPLKNRAAAEYTAASLITKNKANWQYGRIEVKAKLPHGRGVWPAIWTLGSNISRIGWPGCGEIDIMEFVGKEPNNIYGTLHYSVDGKHRSDQGKLEAVRPFDDFHIYAVEWSPSRIDFFFDSQKYHTAVTDKADNGMGNPFRMPHYLLLNFALGGGWGGPIDDASLPQKFLIDYVRVYQVNDQTWAEMTSHAPQ